MIYSATQLVTSTVELRQQPPRTHITRTQDTGQNVQNQSVLAPKQIPSLLTSSSLCETTTRPSSAHIVIMSDIDDAHQYSDLRVSSVDKQLNSAIYGRHPELDVMNPRA